MPFNITKVHTHIGMLLYSYIAKHNLQSVFSIMFQGREDRFLATGVIDPFYSEVPEVDGITFSRLDPNIL